MLELLDIEDIRWGELLGGQNDVNIFQTPVWSSMLQQAYHLHPFILAHINTEGKVTAGIPIIEKKSIQGNISWVSLPYTDYCAPLSSNITEESIFYKKLNQYIIKYHERKFELRWVFPGVTSLLPKQDYVLHKLALQKDFSSNLKLIHPGNKQNARAARKHGLQIEISSDIQHLREFYHLHLLTRHRHGVPIQPWSYFKTIMSKLLEKDLGFIISAYQGDSCLASAMFLKWNTNLIYKYGASNPASLQLRPNDLIMEEVIHWGCDHGYTSLDFGRTDLANTGLRNFKSYWGAEETDLIYSFSPVIPPNRPVWMNNMLNQLIRNSPLWICRLIGELLYRYAG
jgi:lipid II:glycine glycyltransferase (peptidoglycan interpeptide bridge formation enzyme)